MAGEKSVRLAILGDNADAKLKLDEIDEKAEALKELHPELSVGIDIAAASAKLALLKEELKSVEGEGDDLSKSLDRVKNAAESIDVAKITAPLAGLAKIGAITSIGPALTPVIAGVGALGAGIASVATGIGVFGEVAKQALATANAADTAKSYKGLSASQVELAKQITNVKGQWASFVQAASPGVSQVLAQGMSLMPRAFRLMQPFLGPTEKALDSLAGSLKGSLAPAGALSKFMGDLAKNSGGEIQKLGTAVGNIAKGLMGVLEAFMPMNQQMSSGIDQLTAKFAKWGQSLGGSSGFKKFIDQAKADWPPLEKLLINVGKILQSVAGQLLKMPTGSLSVFGSLTSAVSGLVQQNPGLLTFVGYLALIFKGAQTLGGAVSAVSGVVRTFKTLGDVFSALKSGSALVGTFWQLSGAMSKIGGIGGGVVTVFKGLGSAFSALKTGIGFIGAFAQLSGVMGKMGSVIGVVQKAFMALDLTMLTNPVTLIIIGIAALVAAFVLLWTKCAWFRDFWKGLWKDIQSIAVEAWHFFDNDVLHPIEDGIGSLVKWFEAVPGKILSALGNVGQILWNAGKAIIDGLFNGLKSAWQGVANFIGGIANWISSHKGPIEVDATLLVPHGRAIMGGLVSGLNDGMPMLGSQLARTTSTIASTRIPGQLGSGGNGTLQIEWVGGAGADREFLAWLKKNIRINGGDPTVIGR